MDKNKENKKRDAQNVDKVRISKDHEDYGYDFVPHLNEWVNIDEQREKIKEKEAFVRMDKCFFVITIITFLRSRKTSLLFS